MDRFSTGVGTRVAVLAIAGQISSSLMASPLTTTSSRTICTTRHQIYPYALGWVATWLAADTGVGDMTYTHTDCAQAQSVLAASVSCCHSRGMTAELVLSDRYLIATHLGRTQPLRQAVASSFPAVSIHGGMGAER